MMRSAANLSYEQAQAAIDGRPDETTGPLLETVLKPLWGAYASLVQARAERDPLDLDLPERKIAARRRGPRRATSVVRERLDAHRLIEEFMIAANVAAAETLEAKRIAADLSRPRRARRRRSSTRSPSSSARIDIKLPKAGTLKPGALQPHPGRDARRRPTAELVNEVVLRTQAQAEYAPRISAISA